MARTIAEIEDVIIAAKEADAVLAAELTSPSVSAIWRRWVNITAQSQHVTESLYDGHKADVAATIAAERAHTLRWYSSKARAFQYGYALPDGSDIYATIDPDAMIVTQSAAVEIADTGRVRIKVAKGAGELEALSTAELTAIRQYFDDVKDAGVRLQVTSNAADDLQLAVTVYYDPLVLGEDGARLDGTSATPVRDAMVAYLKALPFNGLLVLERMEDKITAVEGVRIGKITASLWRYGATDFASFTIEKIPDAGYFALDLDYFDDNVTYTPHDPID